MVVGAYPVELEAQKIESLLHVNFHKMIYTMNRDQYSVADLGLRVIVDDTWFDLKEGKVYDKKNRHVYTLYPETARLELGEDYQSWYIEDQIPVEFEEWKARKSGKNIIIDGTVYQIKQAACLWPCPKLFLCEKHVGFIQEDQLIWIGKR